MTDPAADVERSDAGLLADWRDFAPTAGDWLSAAVGLPVAGTPADLGPLWAAALPRIRPADNGGGEPSSRLPAWARWPHWAPFHRTFDPPTVELLGALTAYVGELLIAQCAPPAVTWHVYRHPTFTIDDEGSLTVTDGRRRRNKVYVRSVSPQRLLLVLGTAQVSEPIDPRYPIVGKDDPQRLAELYRSRLTDLDLAAGPAG